MSRDTRAISSALPQLLRLTIEIISGANLPSSIRRPTRNEACMPSAISVSMSASFFCTSWVAGSGQHAPGNAVAGAVEAAERALEAGHVGQQRVLRHHHAVHHDLAGNGGAQGKLAADLRRRQAFHALFENEAADLVVMRGGFRPDDED